MKKNDLEKLIDKEFEGNWVALANEMIVLFCEKYDIMGSTGSYNLYSPIQEAIKKCLKEADKHEELISRLYNE